MSGTSVISITLRRELSSSFMQGKVLKQLHAILMETLACFLPGRAKELPVPQYRSAPIYTCQRLSEL